MKKFAQNIFKFLVSVVFIELLILILSYSTIRVPFYFDNYSNELVNLKNIDLSFFGDSHSEYGFNDKLISNLLNKNTRNISLSGNTLYNNILILEKVLSINPNMVVNLSIGNHNVGESYFLTGYNVDKEIKRWFPYYNFKEIIYLFKNYPKKFLKGFFGIISSIGIETYGFSEGVSRMGVLRESSIEKKSSSKDYHNSKPLWLSKLKNLIKENPDTNFKIIRIPIHNDVFTEEKFYLSIINNITELNNVEFQDYQNIKLVDKDFRDFTHLSNLGAEKLSTEYIKRNEENIKTLR